MRLRDIHHTLVRNLDLLTPESGQATGGNIRLNNLPQLEQGLEAIAAIPMLKERSEELLREDFIRDSHYDSIVIPKTNFDKFTTLLNSIRNQGIQIKSILNAFLEKQEEHSVSIKLPKTTDLETIASHLVNPKKSAELRERIKMSVSLVEKMIGQGVEFYPSLAAPDNARDMFPSPKKLLASVKQIADGQASTDAHDEAQPEGDSTVSKSDISTED